MFPSNNTQRRDLGYAPNDATTWAPKLPYLDRTRNSQDLDATACQKTFHDANEQLGRYVTGITADEEVTSQYGSGRDDSDNASLRSFGSYNSYESGNSYGTYKSEHSDFYGDSSRLDVRGAAQATYEDQYGGQSEAQGVAAQWRQAQEPRPVVPHNEQVDAAFSKLRRRHGM